MGSPPRRDVSVLAALCSIRCNQKSECTGGSRAGQRHQLEQYRVHGDQRDGGAPAVGARVCATQVVKPAS